MTGLQAAIAQLREEGLDVTEWRDDAGTSYEEHAHPAREVRIVLEGSITFVVAGQTHELGAGDRIDLAPMQPHAAVVGPDGAHYLAGTDRRGGLGGIGGASEESGAGARTAPPPQPLR